MVPVVQLVRASECGSECRGFESPRAHWKNPKRKLLFVWDFSFVRFWRVFDVISKESRFTKVDKYHLIPLS